MHTYLPLSDIELDDITRDILVDNPNCGYRMLMGHLWSRGIKIQQLRVRESLHRVAPMPIALRWNATIVHRSYCVKAPLSLWHIDGNHKLIR